MNRFALCLAAGLLVSACSTPASTDPPQRTGLWALLVATTSGQENYRHQADVLAQYQLLRSNGVPDDRIILVLADDLGNDVPYEIGGSNVRRGASVDHELPDLDAEQLLDLLRDLDTRPTDDLYLFIAGHGTPEGIPVEGSDPMIEPAGLARAIDETEFRHLLVAIEGCDAGVFEEIENDRVALLAAAPKGQKSLATNYDRPTDTWLADDFSYELLRLMRDEPGLTLPEAVPALRENVRSDVQLAGGTDDFTLGEFVRP